MTTDDPTTDLTSAPAGRAARARGTLDHPPPRRLGTLAVVWWGVGAALAVVDAVTGRAEVGAAAVAPDALNSGLLRDVPDGTLSAGIAALAVLGAVVAAWMRWGRDASRAVRATALAAAAVVLAGATLLVDATVLAGLGYLPALLVTSAFSAEVRAKLSTYVEPGFLFQASVLVGAVLLAVVAVRYARRTAAACERCGRRHDGADPAWTTPAAAARWGRTAALLAAAIPAFYGVTRIAWVLGIPLGFDRSSVESMRGIHLVGPIGLGVFALLGAVLTLGLFQRWGEVFPRWMAGLAGRRVPVGLAVVPATLVAVAVLPAGLSMIAIGMQQGLMHLDADTWGAIGPTFLWPLWSVALGAATYAYWLRRRGTCRTCGRG
ncbi:hypothetical protein [Isoptericola cucumis]|uniref:Uncharacterized protein n=1 Tax=Isoptericola cucumis TaxID=1776856 RepID=A0ABQ2BAM1_9MICO|nr:hypothetical protein [Isoptericola cucumis]GGI09490.1 hypothetical protein GCM10007368_26440 [Isoptericola cucumis]